MKKSTMAILSVVVVVVLLIIGVLGWGVRPTTKFAVLDESISAAESTIQTQLQRRADLIPNLVNTVKGYARMKRTYIPPWPTHAPNWPARRTRPPN